MMHAILRRYLRAHDNIDYALRVSIKAQCCDVYGRDGKVLRSYPISSSQQGISAQAGSFGTPLGLHEICARFGEGMPIGMCFKGRQATGEIATIECSAPPTRSEGDFILTRIMWLRGLEQGLNQGEGIDSYERYIYIHGTNEEYLIGEPASHGCIRMHNRDVIELFDLAGEGTPVYIDH